MSGRFSLLNAHFFPKDARPAALRVHVLAHAGDPLALQHEDEAIGVVVASAVRQRGLHAFLHDHRFVIGVDRAEFYQDIGDEKLRERDREEMHDGVAPDHVMRAVERNGGGVTLGSEPLRVWREAVGNAGGIA